MEFIKFLGFPTFFSTVTPTESFTMCVANGESLKCQGRFEGMHVNLQGILFTLILYSFPLAGLNFVLGVQWLELLGHVVCAWRKMAMEFRWGQ